MNPAVLEASRRKALDCANEIRHRRSVLKEELREGSAILAEVLIEDEAYLQTMKLMDLLLATPGIGSTKARRVFAKLKLPSDVQMESVSIGRREDVLAYLRLNFPQLTSVAA
jgi:hypothetical protein